MMFFKTRFFHSILFKAVIYLFFGGLTNSVFAQEIKKPAVEFSNSGLLSIDRIFLADTATLVDVRIDFIPGWWTMFSKKDFLEDMQTGEKYFAKQIKGAEFDKKLTTPASGQTMVTLVFPKLDKQVKKVNFGEDKNVYLFGVSLEKNAIHAEKKSVSADVRKWLDNQVNAAKKTELIPAEGDLFKVDTIKIVGYIKGYDKRAGFSSGIIYYENQLTGEDFPTTIRIFDDGRFEAAFLANHPVQSFLCLNNRWIRFYAEPGNTIGLILDWNEFLKADRYRNIRYDFEDTEYLGATKTVNEELKTINIASPDYKNLENFIKQKSPEDFKALQLAIWDREKTRIDSILSKKQLLPTTERLIRNGLDLSYANFLFDYALDRNYYQKQDSTNEILKIALKNDYYDFIKRIDLNNQKLIATDGFATLINRYEFSPLYQRTFLPLIKNVQNDSNYFKGSESTFISHVAKLRELVSVFEEPLFRDKESNQKKLVEFTADIDHPVLINEAKRMFDQVFNRDSNGYELPETAGGEIFKKIIDKHKGKVLIVDFWAQWCAPCRSGIEHSLADRRKYKNKPDLDFLFITDEESTDADFYAGYIQENMMTNTYRIKADEYLALRELFRFNGIPRYVLVDENGRIKDDNFEMYNYKMLLQQGFPQKFNNDYFN